MPTVVPDDRWNHLTLIMGLCRNAHLMFALFHYSICIDNFSFSGFTFSQNRLSWLHFTFKKKFQFLYIFCAHILGHHFRKEDDYLNPSCCNHIQPTLRGSFCTNLSTVIYLWWFFFWERLEEETAEDLPSVKLQDNSNECLSSQYSPIYSSVLIWDWFVL